MASRFLADQVFYNGNVITLDPSFPRATSVAIKSDRILFVGDDSLVDAAPPSKRFDLQGRALLPGFYDAHNHMMKFGLTLGHLDVGTPDIKCVADILKAVAGRAQTTSNGAWILGRNYDENKLVEKRPPSRQELDAVAPENPVLLQQNSGHMSVVNSVALRLSGVKAETSDPPGGRIVRDLAGEPTGLLQEGAQRLVVAESGPRSVGEMVEALRLASDVYLSEGITSSAEAGAGLFSPLQLKAFMQARREGKLNVRIYLMVSAAILRKIPGALDEPVHFGLDQGLHTGFGDEWLRVGPMKIFADGSLIGRTCAMEAPYENEPGNRGFFTTDPPALREAILDAHQSGWQVAVHAIGDRAIGTVLDIYEEALRTSPRPDCRHRIEHCGVVTPEIIARMAALGVIPVPQQAFISELGDGFRRVLGEARTGLCYPMRSFLDAGLPMPGSSDRPVVPGAPLLGIHDSVNQVTSSGRPYQPNEALTPEEALRCYTLGSAYASFEEGIKGSIEPGKLADFVILSDDPTRVDKTQIKHIRVLATIVGGEVKYKNPRP